MARKASGNNGKSVQDNRTTLAVRVDQRLVKELKKHCVEHDTTLRDIVEQLVRDFLKKK